MDLGVTQDKDTEQAMPDGAAEAPTLRRCIVTREALEKDQLIRFVPGPEGEIVPDLAQNLPGRGAWVTAERKVLAQAVKKNAFSRALQMPVTVPADLVERVAALLDRQVLDLLGLARRSGLLVSGFEKVDVALATGRAALLIEASDAGNDGRSKLARHARPGVEIWAPLPAEQLGRAIGRDHAVHVAVGPGGLAKRLKAALRRQKGFHDHAASGSAGNGRTAGPRAAQPE